MAQATAGKTIIFLFMAARYYPAHAAHAGSRSQTVATKCRPGAEYPQVSGWAGLPRASVGSGSGPERGVRQRQQPVSEGNGFSPGVEDDPDFEAGPKPVSEQDQMSEVAL